MRKRALLSFMMILISLAYSHEVLPRDKAVLIHNRYLDNGNNTITDIETGLMWVKAPVKKRLKSYGRVGGHGDWRLPTAEELGTLSKTGGKAPYKELLKYGFRNIKPVLYETSTEGIHYGCGKPVRCMRQDTYYHTAVSFKDGTIDNIHPKSGRLILTPFVVYVWPVRSAAIDRSRYPKKEVIRFRSKSDF